MIIVADTIPLISLMKCDCLGVLRDLFGEVQLPEAVYTELTSNPKFEKEAIIIANSDFIRRVNIEDRKSVSLFKRATGLDIGESEAIILSDNIHADFLLMDEVKGRKIALQMGIRIMGTIGILLLAYDSGILSAEDIEEAVEFLRGSNCHISEKLFEQLLNKISRKE
ncbi:MAG: DUF3368 domain-containing protein [Roseburia sp.]|nr:DUF3368 domain-containing protein [Roseburia sp.]